MQNPFHIAFKGMAPNKVVETEVRAWLDKLSALTDASGMMSGSIVIESIEHRGTRRDGGMRYLAHVQLTTLDDELTIGRDDEANPAAEDVFVAVRNVFRLLRRALTAAGERRRAAGAVETVPAHDLVDAQLTPPSDASTDAAS